MTTYRVTEVFYTLQGEGYWSGRPAVFCRFAGCNLWSGAEWARGLSICSFCDTDFRVNFEMDAMELSEAIKAEWPGGGEPMVVFTGGEPALQLDEELMQHFDTDWYVAVETNGTVPLRAEVDWVCVSPKTPGLRTTEGDELKLVYPQRGRVVPETYEELSFNVFWLSPMDGPNLAENTSAAVEYVKSNPLWRLNTQMHKQIGIR